MNDVPGREQEQQDRLASGLAQHAAQPAIRMWRAHIVSQFLFHTEAGAGSRVLSLGCGAGDTELVLSPYVGEILGIDGSDSAVRQARENAAAKGVTNLAFTSGAFEEMPAPQQPFDAALAIHFLRDVPDVAAMARRMAQWLRPGGVLYLLDATRRIVPRLREEMVQAFASAGFEARTENYDFASSRLARLLPAWGKTYLVSRLADDWILRMPGLRNLGSSFQLIARKPG